MPIKKPAAKRNDVLLKNDEASVFAFMTPKSGYSTMGRRLVTASGTWHRQIFLGQRIATRTIEGLSDAPRATRLMEEMVMLREAGYRRVYEHHLVSPQVLSVVRFAVWC